mmetsp:Transcript_475/g.1328  ORF Transcript_475/g.1328 Transcript_475/m.1328 type:complete len:594 (-) Transcript_475:3-1784(-)
MARVLDASLVHVPYEELAQASRESRAAVASDLDTLMRSISALSAPAEGEASSGEADSGAGSSGRGVSANEARQVVSGLVEQINRLKRKVDEGRRAEAEGIARCRSRIASLLSHSSVPEDGAAGGGGARLADARCDRFVADYLLRTGRHHSAAALCASANGGVAALLDERNAPCVPRSRTHTSPPPEHRAALACSCLLLPVAWDGSVCKREAPAGGRRRQSSGRPSVGRTLTECRRVTDALLRQDAGPALQWCERESARRHRPPPLLLPLPTAAHSRAAQQAHARLPHCADPPLAARRLCTLHRCSHPAGTLSRHPSRELHSPHRSCHRAQARQAALAARAAAAAAALPCPRRRGCRRRGHRVREAPPAAGRLAGGCRGGGEARDGAAGPWHAHFPPARLAARPGPVAASGRPVRARLPPPGGRPADAAAGGCSRRRRRGAEDAVLLAARAPGAELSSLLRPNPWARHQAPFLPALALRRHLPPLRHSARRGQPSARPAVGSRLRRGGGLAARGGAWRRRVPRPAHGRRRDDGLPPPRLLFVRAQWRTRVCLEQRHAGSLVSGTYCTGGSRAHRSRCVWWGCRYFFRGESSKND